MGSGCRNCPVNPCKTMTYRGSVCKAQREKLGLGDPMTNADLIRSMDDEVLARYLAVLTDDIIGKRIEICENPEAWLQWLTSSTTGAKKDVGKE